MIEWFSHKHMFVNYRFIEEKTKCSFWAKKADKSKAICDKREEYDTLFRLNKMIANADEKNISEETGCLFSCEKFAYDLRPLRPLEKFESISQDLAYQYTGEFEQVSTILQLDFTMLTGNYMEFSQVRIKYPHLLSFNIKNYFSTRSTTGTASFRMSEDTWGFSWVTVC